jgi:hypothetical protein
MTDNNKPIITENILKAFRVGWRAGHSGISKRRLMNIIDSEFCVPLKLKTEFYKK